MAASKSGMELAPMKQLLNKAAPDNPIPFAFGLGTEPGFALLMLDKAGKNPKGVLKSLEEEFKDAKNTRWGTAVVEPERANLVKFIVNKPVSGMAKRLTKTLKGTGYPKVEIVLEDGTVVEGAADDEEEGAPVSEVSAPTAPGAPPPPPPGPPPSAGPTAEQKAKLTAGLMEKLKLLIPRIGPAGAAQPDMLEQLKKFANDASANIKTGNFTYANAAITQLATALDKISPAGTAPSGGAPLAESGKLWEEAGRQVGAEVEKLRAQLVATYQPEGIEKEVEASYDKLVAPLLDKMKDASLAAKLGELGGAPDAAARGKLVEEATRIVGGYAEVLKFPFLADLDSNPFVPLSIKDKVTGALTGLSQAIKKEQQGLKTAA